MLSVRQFSAPDREVFEAVGFTFARLEMLHANWITRVELSAKSILECRAVKTVEPPDFLSGFASVPQPLAYVGPVETQVPAPIQTRDAGLASFPRRCPFHICIFVNL